MHSLTTSLRVTSFMGMAFAIALRGVLDDEYGRMRFREEDEFAGQSDINPSKIVPHEWKKLQTIWKSINADYQAAYTRFTISGTNENNFFPFCNGKLDVYYLRRNLSLKPNLVDTVIANLPDKTFNDSELPFLPMPTISYDSNQIPLSSYVSKPSRKRYISRDDKVATTLDTLCEISIVNFVSLSR